MQSRGSCGCLLVLLTVLLTPVLVPAQSGPTESELRAIVGSARLEGLRWPEFARDRSILQRLYESTAYAPLWLDRGRPIPQARDAIAALRDADAKGLDPRDYDADVLGEQAQRLAADGEVPPSALARFDAALSIAVVRLISDLHVGRVNPRSLHLGYDVDAKKSELTALAYDTIRYGRIREGIDAVEASFTQRRLLQAQLARYRQLARDVSLAPVELRPTIRPGDPLGAASPLAHWLVALGDLAADVPVSPAYEGALVEAVQRFQLHHGLAPDGVIGAATAKALAVPAAARVRQIELALERLRWLPVLERGRAVFVNVPAFEVVAFDDIGAGKAPVLQMSVVVGRAFRTETPFFTGAMETVVFAPYWNVPRSIVRKEILPRLRKDPAYLAAQEMEIVSVGRVLAPSADAIERLAQGGAELRQRPGPQNALGRVKFLFPNAYRAYMHDTPARHLFERTQRDFSHGCIRLADAAALARWVLAGEGWDAARVDDMLAATRETFVPLRHPIPVVIAYATAVAHVDGTIAFYGDIYGHDAALERALGGGSRYLR